MAIARFVLKTLDGIDRPAIAGVIPNQKGGSRRCSTLAPTSTAVRTTCSSLPFLGAALVEAIDEKERPTVGLLNIGEEVIKGNDVVKEAGELLRGSQLNFYGNVEGNDIFKGRPTSSCATASSAMWP